MIEPKKSIMIADVYSPPKRDISSFLRLDSNENSYGCSECVKRAIRDMSPEKIWTYPNKSRLTEKLSCFLGVQENRILITNGADEAIKTVFDCYVDCGDEIVIPVPTFQLYESCAKIAGAKITKVPYGPDFGFPEEMFINSINSDTRLAIIVNPNNPTGGILKSEYIESILKKWKDCILIVDEAYIEYSDDSSSIGLLEKYRNLVIIRTFSKAWGLAGLRLGYIVADEGIVRALEKVISPYSVNAFAIEAGIAALDDPGFVRECAQRVLKSRSFVASEIESLGFKAYPSGANFILVDFGAMKGIIFEGLKKRGILVRDVSANAMLDRCLRLTVGKEDECARLVDEIRKIVSRKMALVFDMDGVLCDVTKSYREAIAKTYEYFSGKNADIQKIQEIQKLKIEGGFNNDWKLTRELLLRDGICVPLDDVVCKFQDLYLGECMNGLILNEKALISARMLERLREKYSLAIMTGRPKKEAMFFLERFGLRKLFDDVVCLEDCNGMEKPDSFGLILALERTGCKAGYYVGDTTDDLACAKGAGLSFIGVSPDADDADRNRMTNIFRKKGADILVENVEYVAEVLL